MNQKKAAFLFAFTVLSFVALQIPFNKLAGSNVSFTLFDFLGPISGAFLGSLWGIASVLAVQLINILVTHAPLNMGAIIRLFPTLFAVYYFSVYSRKSNKQNNWILVVPLLATVSFVLNPVGRTVWYYSLFWLIPLVASRLKSNLYVRSLGATFTAHAVGGAAWIWAFHLPAAVWKSLIPVVIEERLLFAAGIAVSYLVIKRVVAFLVVKKVISSSHLPAASV